MGAGDLVTNSNISQAAVQGAQTGVQNAAAQQQDKLKAYLTSQQAQADVQNKITEEQGLSPIKTNQALAESQGKLGQFLAGLKQAKSQGLIPSGAGFSLGDKGAEITRPMNQFQGPQEAGKFGTKVTNAFKPINDGLDSARTTMENLDLGTTAGDNLAFINEARQAMAGTGGHALGATMAQITGQPTAEGGIAQLSNYAGLGGTHTIPKMTDDYRNSLRTAAMSRLPQYEDLTNQNAQQLTNSGQYEAPYTDYASIVKNAATTAQTKLAYLKNYKPKYHSAAPQGQNAAAGGNAPPSAPNAFNLGGGNAAAQGQTQQQPATNTMRVKRMQDGLTGTITTDDFKNAAPGTYTQVQ